MLVFEDLHWADDGLLDFVDALVDVSSGVPLLVVCTARPELLERRPGWGGGKRNAQKVSFTPLSDDETALASSGRCWGTRPRAEPRGRPGRAPAKIHCSPRSTYG